MSIKEEPDFNVLLAGYLNESLNPEELELFFDLSAKPENSLLLEQSYEQYLESDPPDLSSKVQSQDARTRLQQTMEIAPLQVRRMQPAMRWAAASVILICFVTATWLLNRSKNQGGQDKSISEIKPPVWLTLDHIGATLFLTNGDSIELNYKNKDVIADQDGIEVRQSGGSITYSGSSQTPMFNEIRTGKGKLWRVILPDKTIVWLNGGSSIKYPLQFAAEVRAVEMTGEVYFEVAHHASHPFRVKSGTVLIEDIGTSFNIKSFNTDTISTTSVAEGSVRLTLHDQQTTVIAGQQTIVSDHGNQVRVVQNANLAEALAWKNGYFYFQNTNLRTVVQEIADWYQVGVVYKGKESKQLFSGQIEKTLSLSNVLRGLAETGVKFYLDSNQQITVIQN